MEWKTKISNFNGKDETVKGFDLNDLIGKVSFSEMIFILLKGEKPKENEIKLMDAILVATAEHGINTPSTLSARVSASATHNLISSLTAGISSIGQYHGGAIESLAQILQENNSKSAKDIVQEFTSKNQRLPGFGHKIYETDPRAVRLFAVANDLGINSTYTKLTKELEQELEQVKGKKLCINIDGCLAALISELNFNWKIANIFFVLPRILGLTAHIQEEIEEEKPYRRLNQEDIKYESNSNS
ncbi:citryl-CoA lyase [archaeon]|nr:citryl-CoA lyase [archaeon]|tara:strand:+ start:36 stop:767 length:732 start_codon:yes stop_codon:yes gene_type:complete